MAGNAEFDDKWMLEFRTKVGPQDEDALAALRSELVEIGTHYRRIIETTPCDLKGSPFNKSLTQRGDWVQVNVVRPTERLLGALSDENMPWFSTWPYESEFEEFPDRSALRAELQKVLDYSTHLLRSLRGEQGVDAGTNQELRFYIFNDIIRAIKQHLSNFVPKQGEYHADMRQFDGRYPAAIRHIYKEITGLDEQLVRLIRMMVKDPDWP